jgi:hypothetical protein
MVLSMVKRSDEVEKAAYEVERKQRALEHDLYKFAKYKLHPMGSREAWSMAMALVLNGEKTLSEQAAIERMISLAVGRGDLSIWTRHSGETFNIVAFRGHHFRCPRWQFGVAKAVIYSEEWLKYTNECRKLEEAFREEYS